MKVGRQFNNAYSLIPLKTYHDASSQTMRITQFGVGYRGIVVSHADLHRFTGKIPRAVGHHIRSKGTQGEHHRNCQ